MPFIKMAPDRFSDVGLQFIHRVRLREDGVTESPSFESSLG